jgi:hypothetical protein
VAIDRNEASTVNIYFVEHNGSDRSIEMGTVKFSDPSAVEALYDTSNHRVLQRHPCFTDVTLDQDKISTDASNT